MRRFTIIEAAQRSPAWYSARVGRLTGSVAGDMLARTKTGWSTSRRNLCLRLVLERLTGKPQENGYVSPAMQAGIDREADAFAAYEALTGQMVQRSGFLSHIEVMAGCSLDGHLGDFDRLLSIKCRQPNAHLDFIRSGAIPADAIAQMHHEMWISGAQAHDYFSWNPDFPPELQSRLVTLDRDETAIANYQQEALVFLAEVECELEAIETMTGVGAQLKAAVA